MMSLFSTPVILFFYGEKMRHIAKTVIVGMAVIVACFFAAQLISSILPYKSSVKPWLILASFLGIFIFAVVLSGIRDTWRSVVAFMPESLRLIMACVFTLGCTFFVLGFCVFFDLPEAVLGIAIGISFFGSIILAGFIFNDRSTFIPDQIFFDSEKVTRTLHDGSTETVYWADLQEIWIVTTNAGPWQEDVFFVLCGSETGCLIPHSAQGLDELFLRLGQLPGFDSGAAIKAMGSTSNNKFLCWKKEDGLPRTNEETSS